MPHHYSQLLSTISSHAMKSHSMRSEDLSKLQTLLSEAGLHNAEATIERLLFWTSGRSSLTNTLVKKILLRPYKNWDKYEIDQLVERTYLWPEIKEVLQAGKIGQTIADHPQKNELIETYLHVLNERAVLAEKDSEFQDTLLKLGLVRVVHGRLKSNNRVYAKIFDRDWAEAHLEDPPIWDEVQELVTPWLTVFNISAVGLALLLLVGGIFWFSRPAATPVSSSDEPIAVLASPTGTSTNTQIAPTAAASSTSEPTSTAQPVQITSVPTETQEPLPPPTEQVQSKPAVTLDPTDTPEAQPTATSMAVSTTSHISITVAAPTVPATEAAAPEYIQPQLLNLFCYEEWENFSPNGQIKLRWSWGGRLVWNEYLEIRVGPNGGNLTSLGKVFAEPNGNIYEWFITPQGYFLDGTTTDYQWQVVHMSSNGRTVLAQSSRGCFTVK